MKTKILILLSSILILFSCDILIDPQGDNEKIYLSPPEWIQGKWFSAHSHEIWEFTKDNAIWYRNYSFYTGSYDWRSLIELGIASIYDVSSSENYILSNLDDEPIYSFTKESSTVLRLDFPESDELQLSMSLYKDAPPITDIETPKLSTYQNNFHRSLDITIETLTSGAEIRYTTDGSDPSSTSGVIYDGTPIKIIEDTELRAIAYINDTESSIESHTYSWFNPFLGTKWYSSDYLDSVIETPYNKLLFNNDGTATYSIQYPDDNQSATYMGNFQWYIDKDKGTDVLAIIGSYTLYNLSGYSLSENSSYTGKWDYSFSNDYTELYIRDYQFDLTSDKKHTTLYLQD